MLKLNTDEKRNLQFEVNIQGINYDELSGSLKFIIEDVHYGFPVKILSDNISVEVPPLDDVVKKGMKDGDIIECKLDIYGNGFFLNPWQGKFQLKTPVKMEAKIRYSDDIITETPKPKKKKEKIVTATLKEQVEELDEDLKAETEDGIKTVLREEPKEKTLDEIDKEVVLNKLFKKVSKYSTPKKTAVAEQKFPKPTSNRVRKIESIVDSILGGKKTVIKEQKRTVKKEVKIVPNDPVSLMESYGMKNKKTQARMIEKAKSIGGDDESSIFSTLQKLLGPTNQTSIFEQYMRTNKQEE